VTSGCYNTKVKKHWRNITATITTASSLAKEAGNSIDTSRIHIYRRSGENKCGHSVSAAVSRVCV